MHTAALPEPMMSDQRLGAIGGAGVTLSIGGIVPLAAVQPD